MSKTADRVDRHHRWMELVKEQEKSDLSQIEFCQQQQLILSQFRYYRSLFKTSSDEENTEYFQPVHVQSNEQTSTSMGDIKLLFPNGLQCVFPSHLCMKQIKQLVEVILSC